MKIEEIEKKVKIASEIIDDVELYWNYQQIDEDIGNLKLHIGNLLSEVKRLRAGIKKHRQNNQDKPEEIEDFDWELYKLLEKDS